MIHNYLGKTREVEYTCSGISWSSYCTWSRSIRSNLFGGIITELKPATAEESYHIDLYHFRFVIQIPNDYDYWGQMVLLQVILYSNLQNKGTVFYRTGFIQTGLQLSMIDWIDVGVMVISPSIQTLQGDNTLTRRECLADVWMATIACLSWLGYDSTHCTLRFKIPCSASQHVAWVDVLWRGT